jgi:UDP-N-acetylglucosamine:LPS N-acetylglucosamine transferase
MKIAFISSKGGHLGQIKLIFTQEVIGSNTAVLITETEDDSKIGYENNSFLKKYKTYYFKKDKLLKIDPFNYLSATINLAKILKNEKIDLVVTNGAQISIPAVIAARFLGIKSIFIDTVIRVKTPNWSARACYPFVDKFFVQHKNMEKVYGRKAKYIGGII